MKRKLILALLVMVVTLSGAMAHEPSIIPTPRNYTAVEGCFTLTSRTTISVEDATLGDAADYLSDHLGIRHAETDGDIRLMLDKSLRKEEYCLSVDGDCIEIRGGDYGGVFSGVVTLLQLLPASVYDSLALPATITCCRIEDAPRYTHRGFMLDVCRTWMTKEAVMEFIDLMAYHKFNRLRLHLTDDEAWRIEIKSHPELAQVGGFRGGDSPIWPRYGKWGEKWGGYYTQEDIRQIIEYARVRNIEVMPEIDLPGHSLTMATLHPEILCNYTPNLSSSFGYDTRSAFCASKQSNYDLLRDILTEVCALFPSEYIHIGGDEVETSQWKQCPDCKALMAEKGYTSPEQLQAYFMTRLSAMLAECGKRPAVWNEAIDGGQLPNNTVVYGWEGVKECREAAAKGYKTVVMPGQYFYFDMKQSKREPGHDWAAIFDWTKVYNVTLTSLGFTPEEQRNILGFEASFFSEAYTSRNPERADYLHYQTFPRLVALAEVAWNSSNHRDKSVFYQRMTAHYSRLDAMGVAYRLMPPKVTYADGKLSAKVDDGSTLYAHKVGTDTWIKYSEPIATTTPSRYVFVSRRGNAMSTEAAVEGYFKTLRPEFTLTSSMPQHATMTYAKAQGYGRLARSSRAPDVGDWVQYTFTTAVKCRSMKLATGNFQLPRFIFEHGYAEISYDGVEFNYAGELRNGMFIIENPDRAIKAVRLVCTSRGNGAKFVSIQPPTIYPVL